MLILSVSAISATDLNDTSTDSPIVAGDCSNKMESFDSSNIINQQDVHSLAIITLDEKEKTTSPGTFDDLQVEINNAPEGSILYLFRDYNGAYGSRIQFNKDLTIDGNNHTLNCLNNDGCSAFYSNNGNIILKNLKIINGHNDYKDKGGAIYIKDSAKYSLENCEFSNNYADDYGGAIYNEADNPLTVKNCKFISNRAYNVHGGAIYSAGEVIIENSLFDSNTADEDGGAVFCKKNVNIKNSVFMNNKVKSREWSWYEYIYHWADNPNCYGGAVRSQAGVYIDNSTFNNNFAEDYGGAIYAKNVKIICNQNLNLSFNSFFTNNVADDNNGGSIYAEGTVDLVNAFFTNNSAEVDGGAVYGKNVNVYHCLFKSNEVKGGSFQCYGGAIRAEKDVTVNNSTFDGNHAEDYGGAIYAKNIKINDNQDNNQSFNSFFINNGAGDNDGGGIYADSEVVVKNAKFSKNNAYDCGGAIYAKGTVNAYHCEFNENSVLGAMLSEGGAIYSKSGVIIENCTFVGNYADSFGSAIYCIKDININDLNDSYLSYFINNTVSKSSVNHDQIYCDKDHGKIYKNVIFREF